MAILIIVFDLLFAQKNDLCADFSNFLPQKFVKYEEKYVPL